MEPLFADFQFLTSVPLGSSPSVLAQLDSPDREHLVTHFSAYSSRIGVDRPQGTTLDRLKSELVNPWSAPSGSL
jgi:hypothetical protein